MKIKRFVNRWFPVFIWMGVIYIVSSISNPYIVIPETVGVSDELIGRFSHVIEYSILAFLAVRALGLEASKVKELRVLVYSFLISLAYSFLDEIHQSFVPRRTFQILDLSFDFFGILIGLAVGYNIFVLKKKN